MAHHYNLLKINYIEISTTQANQNIPSEEKKKV